MSNMYLLKEKQRFHDFSRQDGRKIQVKPECRESSVGYSRKLPISFPDVRTVVHSILPAHHSVQTLTFRSVYYPLPFYLENFPTEDVQYYYSTDSRQQNLVKKTDLILLNGGIFTNILMLHLTVTLQDNKP
jgi:hypothetical protein